MSIMRTGTKVIVRDNADVPYRGKVGRVTHAVSLTNPHRRWLRVDFGQGSVERGEVPARYVSFGAAWLQRHDEWKRQNTSTSTN